jgi:hypothetical protein
MSPSVPAFPPDPAPALARDGSPEASRPGTSLLSAIGRAFDAFLGFATLVPVLAVVSAVPVLNLLSLGYVLEASGRIARTGRFRDGWVGLAGFAAFGKIVAAIWILSLPVRLVHSFWQDAELIAPGGPNAVALRVLLVALILALSLHLGWAILRGGKVRHFLWPAPWRFVKSIGAREGLLRASVSRLMTGVRSLRLACFFRLGAFGFAGAALWLAGPVLVLMVASGIENPGISFLGSLLGSILLGLVVLYLPMLQTRFARSGRFGEFVDLRAVRHSFRKAPLAFSLALTCTLLFALPLYLLKIELTPDELAWLPNLVFVLFILPARMILGWALSRAERRELPRIWVSRWAARLAALPVVAVYVFVVWFAQYLTWHGSLSLLEQHAFLVPAPLLGL